MSRFPLPRTALLVGVAATAAGLVAASMLTPSGAAESPSHRDAATKADYVNACPQETGPASSIGDLNVTLDKACGPGVEPVKLALWPLAQGAEGPRGPQGPQGPQGAPGTAANAEYGVASIYVSRGGERPARFATFSTALGSPIGSTTGGQFRFTCSPAQAPCKISWGAAVISKRAGTSLVYPRILIHKQTDAAGGSPMMYCEYADGANNNLGVARVQRVPSVRAAIPAMRDEQGLGVGGSLDCGAGQPWDSRVNEIWVPAGDAVTSNFYDVWVTLTFR